AKGLLTMRQLVEQLHERTDVESGQIEALLEKLVQIGAISRHATDVRAPDETRLLLQPAGYALLLELERGEAVAPARVGVAAKHGIDQIEGIFLSRVAPAFAKSCTDELIMRARERLDAAPHGPFTKFASVFGLYLLFNGAIDKQHALKMHLQD